MYEGKGAEVFALLKKELRWAGEKSAFYKERFRAAGLEPKKINTWEDFGRVPCLEPAELGRTDAFRLLTLPLSGVLRAARMGKGTLKFFTRGDVMQNVEMLIGALSSCGVGRGSLAGVMGDLSKVCLLDVEYALECMGVTAVPMGEEPLQARELMGAFAMDTLITTPELLAGLISSGMDLKNQPLRRVILLSDALPVPQMAELAKSVSAKIYGLFAPGALGTAGLLIPCEDGTYRLAEKFFYAEVLDFGAGEPKEAERGELIVTALRAEAMPLIRLRTGLKVRRLAEGAFPQGRLEILG